MISNFHWLKCVVCGKKKEFGRTIQFFKFPREINRCRAWLKAIGKKELITIPIEELCELLVCASHFNPECINEKRLHKVGIPCLSPYPALSDYEMAGYPKHRAISNTVPLTHVFSLNELEYNTSSDNQVEGSKTNTSPIIDYGRPLMNSLEPFIQDDYLAIQTPTGFPSSIAVPLMSYSSSTKQGTVFGVEDPQSTFDLPFASFTESQIHRVYDAKKIMSKTKHRDQFNQQSNDKETLSTNMGAGVESPEISNMETEDMAYSVHPKALDVPLTPNKEKTEPKILTKQNLIKITPSDTNPLSKIIHLRPNPGKAPAISNKLRIISNIKINNPTSGTLNQPPQTKTKALRQYTNTKRTRTMQKKRNLIYFPIGTTDQEHTTDLNANPASIVAVNNDQHGMTFSVPKDEMVAYDHKTSLNTMRHVQSSIVNSGKTSEVVYTINQVAVNNDQHGMTFSVPKDKMVAYDHKTSLNTLGNVQNSIVNSGKTSEVVYTINQVAVNDQHGMTFSVPKDKMVAYDHKTSLNTLGNVQNSIVNSGNTSEVVYTINQVAVNDQHGMTFSVPKDKMVAYDHKTSLNTLGNVQNSIVNSGNTSEVVYTINQVAVNDQHGMTFSVPKDKMVAYDHKTSLNTLGNVQNSIVNSDKTSEVVYTINPSQSLAADTSQVELPTSSDDTSCTEITFVPYTQYEANVTPDSPFAHIAEGTMDYGLPLMNCVGTIFQGNMQYTMSSKKSDFDDTVIDVPLMQYLKTLEYANIQ